MTYDPIKKVIQIKPADAELAIHSIRYALRHIRSMAGLPMDKYKSDGALTHADHAQRGIIQACERLGIDLGAEWGNELDLR